MIPAMLPPPMPVKLFEFAAGVFEMKAVLFFLAIMAGKFVRFLIWAVITVLYGPAILHSLTRVLREHLSLILSIAGVSVLVLGVYVIRKLFDRRRGTRFPVEEDSTA